MSIADFLVGFFCIPFYIPFSLSQLWPFGRLFCKIWVTVDDVATMASVINIVAISVNRYWSIAYPISYRKYATQQLVYLVMCTVWFISFVNFAPGIWLISILAPDYRAVNTSLVTSECSGDYNHSFIYMLIAQFNYFIWPFIVLFILNILIMWNIWQRTRKMTHKTKTFPQSITANTVIADKSDTKEIKKKDASIRRRSSVRTIVLINDKHTNIDQDYCNGGRGIMIQGENDSYPDIEDDYASEHEFYDSVHNDRRFSTIDRQFLTLPTHKQRRINMNSNSNSNSNHSNHSTHSNHTNDNSPESIVSNIVKDDDLLAIGKFKILRRRASDTFFHLFGKSPMTTEYMEPSATCYVKSTETEGISVQVNNEHSNGELSNTRSHTTGIFIYRNSLSPMKKSITQLQHEEELQLTNYSPIPPLMKRHSIDGKHSRLSLMRKPRHTSSPKITHRRRYSLSVPSSFACERSSPGILLNPICELDSVCCNSSQREIQLKPTQYRSKNRSFSLTIGNSDCSCPYVRLSKSDTVLYKHDALKQLKVSKSFQPENSSSKPKASAVENREHQSLAQQKSVSPPSSKKKRRFFSEKKQSSETITSDVTYSNNCIKSSSGSQDRPTMPMMSVVLSPPVDKTHIIKGNLRKTVSSPPVPVAVGRFKNTKTLLTRVSAPAATTSKRLHRHPRRHQRDIRIMRDKKAARSLFILVVVFLIFLLPYVIVATASTAGFHISSLVFEIAFWLLWLNSAFNPFLYPFIQVKYRKAYVKLFSCLRSHLWSICTCLNKQRYQHHNKENFV
ncbi:unnamed protein product [Didymodactylos carnosus]|nr:unnamed protein product [Didymodactylos carnosus]CAF4105913.1 unnamed protein product [Didymodactylos carnosus]